MQRLTAERILTREDEVKQSRRAAEEKLTEAKDLEKQWQQKQAEMDQVMKVRPQLSYTLTCPAIFSSCTVLKVGDSYD